MKPERPRRGKRPSTAPAKVSELFNSALGHLGITAKLKEYGLKKTWADAVGTTLVAKAAPEKLIGATLYCAVCSSAWMTELTYQKQLIIAKLNEKLGAGTVGEIVFKLGKVSPFGVKVRPPSPPLRPLTKDEEREIEAAVKGVRNETLREAVKKAMSKAKAGNGGQ